MLLFRLTPLTCKTRPLDDNHRPPPMPRCDIVRRCCCATTDLNIWARIPRRCSGFVMVLGITSRLVCRKVSNVVHHSVHEAV
jgi:hypothetical protein